MLPCVVDEIRAHQSASLGLRWGLKAGFKVGGVKRSGPGTSPRATPHMAQEECPTRAKHCPKWTDDCPNGQSRGFLLVKSDAWCTHFKGRLRTERRLLGALDSFGRGCPSSVIGPHRPRGLGRMASGHLHRISARTNVLKLLIATTLGKFLINAQRLATRAAAEAAVG